MMSFKYAILLVAAFFILDAASEGDNRRCDKENERRNENTCYSFYLNDYSKRSYLQATNEPCHGRLAMVKTEAIQKFLAEKLTEFGYESSVLIGLSKNKGTKKWQFDDGTPLGDEYDNWDGREVHPAASEVYNCAMINMYDDHGKWQKARCDSKKHFICEYTLSENTLPQDTAADMGSNKEKCKAKNERKFGNTCYQFHYSRFDKHNYFEARGTEGCNGPLAMVKTEEIQNFLVSELNHTFNLTTSVYIGLTKVDDKKNWKYNDGTPLGEYKPWGVGRPKTLGSKVRNCAIINIADDNGKWEDVHCGTSRHYICQY